jgi:mannose-1-phosphate guanylyltransferase/mannose-6-phosphate isomerase
MEHLPHLYPVILAGGSGTGFWPLSRHRYPKELLRVAGSETLIQQTMRRALSCAPAERVLISTTPPLTDQVRIQLDEWEQALRGNFIVEPVARNTAPAIGLTALRLLRRDPDAIMLVLPADHVLEGETEFRASMALAASLADEGYLVTFGVNPTRPETGYGYIQSDRRERIAEKGALSAHPLVRFVEKPDVTTATEYLETGEFHWNSGMFVWRATTILEELKAHEPDLAHELACVAELTWSGEADLAVEAAHRRLRTISIDEAVMERTRRAVVIPVDFGRSAVGSLSSLQEIGPLDSAHNFVRGRVVDLESQNCILYGDRRLVATIGLSDMIIVDTPDATLVCPKSRSQDVGRLVEVLERQGTPEHLEHVTIYRPWGSYTVLDEGPGYKVKRLTVNPGRRLSLQTHAKRSEDWVVVAGTAQVTRGRESFQVSAGQSVSIPAGMAHRLGNTAREVLQVIEVQNGTYVGEDDIVRLQDDYGRVGDESAHCRLRPSPSTRRRRSAPGSPGRAG